MPELPEVEIITRELINEIINQSIIKTFNSEFKLRGKPIPNLNILIGEVILNIQRRNKYIILITNKYYLLIHLGMTGQLLVAPYVPIKKHIHAIIEFKEKILYYQDIRRFGHISIHLKKEITSIDNIPNLKNLGIEPLSKEFTLEYLKNIIKSLNKKNINNKKFIMDGQYICGIGNIYANEILFLSFINPENLIYNLTDFQINSLYINIKKVLNKAIKMGGSTISDFIHTNGKSGNMQNYYNVYGKENQLCNRCKNIIKRIKQNGRSTFYCPFCQK